MFLLGVCALVDAFWAMAGDDLFGDVLGVLQPVLEDAVPGLDGQVAAAGAVPPAGILPAGLAVLSVLAKLCRSDSESVLQRTTSPCGLAAAAGRVGREGQPRTRVRPRRSVFRDVHLCVYTISGTLWAWTTARLN